MQNVLVGMYSNQGAREYNEDSCTALKHGNSICAIMADGLGGHGGGDKASQEAVEVIRTHFKSIQANELIHQMEYESWFEEANDNILEMQTNDCKMKTTLAVLCVNRKKKMANWAHLGDSRIYHFVDRKVRFYTFDHSVSRMAVLAGEINIEDVRFHKDRSKLLKAIGRENFAPPEYGEIALSGKGRDVFLLCTDGFWEYVTEDEMEQTLQKASNPEEWLGSMYKILQNKVKRQGINNDNNSAIALFL